MRALLILVTASSLFANNLRLIDAVKRRDHKAVTVLLKQGANVNELQPDGATALSWAAYLGDRETAEALLKAGAKVETADEYGETPLTLACAVGDAALIQKLLAAGANPNAARWNGESALMIAANAGSAEGVRVLLDKGASVNAAEQGRGQTALMWAAAEGHGDVVKLLIERGADVKAKSKSGFTPIVFAAVKNDEKSARALLAAGADPNYLVSEGTKVLNVATSYKSGLVAGVLVEGGADPNVPDRTGNSPLHAAAQAGDLELVKKLLAKGANANARTAKAPAMGGRGGGGGGFRFVVGEQTPLMLAARANQLDVMKALIAGGADTKLKAQDGSGLLMAAVGSGHVEAVQLAFEYDQDVKFATETGTTLMHASVTGTMQNSTQVEICKVVQFLADKGAPLDEKDARGRTPIAVANVLPIDFAVDLLDKLITKSGATPKISPKR